MSNAAKQWAVNILSPAAGPLAVLQDGLALSPEIGPGATSPVDLLLVSIGTCFALSCHLAFAARGLTRVGFEVSVRGQKAVEPPSRLTNIKLEVRFDADLPLAKAQAIAFSAKQLCTVTNTMTSQPACPISVDVTTPQSAGDSTPA